MTKERKVRFTAFEKLSPEGRALVLAGAADDSKLNDIHRGLAEATGEKIAAGSLHRFVAAWRVHRDRERRAQQHARNLVAAIKEANLDSADLGESLITQSLLENLDDAGSLDLKTALSLNARHVELQNKKRELDQKDEKITLARQQLEIANKRIEAQQRRLAEVKQKARQVERSLGKNKDLTPEIKTAIRELYGLAGEEAHAA